VNSSKQVQSRGAHLSLAAAASSSSPSSPPLSTLESASHHVDRSAGGGGYAAKTTNTTTMNTTTTTTTKVAAKGLSPESRGATGYAYRFAAQDTGVVMVNTPRGGQGTETMRSEVGLGGSPEGGDKTKGSRLEQSLPTAEAAAYARLSDEQWPQQRNDSSTTTTQLAKGSALKSSATPYRPHGSTSSGGGGGGGGGRGVSFEDKNIPVVVGRSSSSSSSSLVSVSVGRLSPGTLDREGEGDVRDADPLVDTRPLGGEEQTSFVVNLTSPAKTQRGAAGTTIGQALPKAVRSFEERAQHFKQMQMHLLEKHGLGKHLAEEGY